MQLYEDIKLKHTVLDIEALDPSDVTPLPSRSDLECEFIESKELYYKDLQIYTNKSIYRGQMK